jgi:hypothetical protein
LTLSLLPQRRIDHCDLITGAAEHQRTNALGDLET